MKYTCKECGVEYSTINEGFQSITDFVSGYCSCKCSIKADAKTLNLFGEKYPNLLPGPKQQYLFIQAGWEDILHELFAKLSVYDNVIICQVKEKFGQLRIYTNEPKELQDTVRALIQEAEEKSSKVCQYCGQPGTIIGCDDGWLRALCSTHENILKELKDASQF